MLSRRLQRKGYLVVTANDGNAALNLMREEQPAIVLLDMNLPIKDGWSVLDEAKEDPTIAHIPIIALTAHAMEEDRQRARVAGCNDYETKPIDLPLLLAKINKLTNNNAY